VGRVGAYSLDSNRGKTCKNDNLNLSLAPTEKLTDMDEHGYSTPSNSAYLKRCRISDGFGK